MQPQSAPQKKMQRHTTNIRRDARHRIIRQMRNELYYETQPISKIAQLFHLHPKQYGDYTIMEILHICYDQLMNVGNVMNQMREDRESGVGVAAHLAFWALLAQELFTDKLTVNNDLLTFFSHLIKKYSYRQLSADKLLQTKILNSLQLSLVPGSTPKKWRIQCLEWIQGTQALTLLYNSLHNQFLCPNQYQNIYQTLIQSHKTHNISKISQSCQIIKHIMKAADYDDTYRIYAEKGQVMVSLLQALNQYIDNMDISKEADAVVYLLDSYDSVIFDYARMGVGLFAVQMIRSKIEGNVLKGLEIVRFITEITELPPILYLLEDRELKEAGLWYCIFGTHLTDKNKNISIKRQCYAILTNIVSNGDRKILSKLNGICLAYEHQTLLQLICQNLKVEEDATILNSILTMLSTFLYYSQNTQTDSESEQPPPPKQQAQLFKHIIKQLVQLQVQKQIKKLTVHRNVEVAENANTIYQSIEFVLREVM